MKWRSLNAQPRRAHHILAIAVTVALAVSWTPLRNQAVYAAPSPNETAVFHGNGSGAAVNGGQHAGTYFRGVPTVRPRDRVGGGPDEPGFACDGSTSVDDSGTGYSGPSAGVGGVTGNLSDYEVTALQDTSNVDYGSAAAGMTHAGNGYGHWIEARIENLSLGGGSNTFDWGFGDPNANFHYNDDIMGLDWNGSYWQVHHDQNQYYATSVQPGQFAYVAEYIDCAGRPHFYIGAQATQLTEQWTTTATLTSGLTQPYYPDVTFHTNPGNVYAFASIDDQVYYDGIPPNVSITDWDGTTDTVYGPQYNPNGDDGWMNGGGSSTTNGTTCAVGRPVNCHTGEFYHTFQDLSIPGRGLPLELTQTYSSKLATQDSPLGYGWTDSYNMFLSTDGSDDYTVHEESGSTITFSCSSTCSGPSWVLGHLTHNSDGTYTLTRYRSQDQFTFSAPAPGTPGDLLSERDRNGYTTTLAYMGNQLSSVTDPAGRELTFQYNAANRIQSVTDAASRSVSFSYDSNGDLTDITDEGGGHWYFTYDSNHLMLTMEDPRQYALNGPLSTGPVVTNTYDGQDRVTEQTDALGRTTSISYATNPDGSETSTITDPKGNVDVETYQNDELITNVAGSGTSNAATTQYSYDPATRGLTSITDPDNHVWTRSYDGNGNLLSSTDPLGHTTTYTYDRLNDVTSVTDAKGIMTTFSYDSNGNVTSVSRPLSGAAPNFSSQYSDAILADKPAVYYRLDETGGTTMYDSSGNGRDGTYTDDPAFKITGAPNDGDQAISVNGPSSSSSGAGLPTASQARTLEAWFKWSGTGSGWQSVMTYGPQSTNNKVAMGVWDSSHVWFSAYSNDFADVPAGKTINDGAWHQLVFTYDGSNTGTLYLDGASLGSQNLGALNTTMGAAGLVLGGNNSGGDGFTGSIDEAAVYPTALTAAQVAAHYDAASAARPSPASNGCTPPSEVGTRTSAAATAFFGYDPTQPGDITAVTDAGGNTAGISYDADGNVESVCDPMGDLTTYGYNGAGDVTSQVTPKGNAPGGSPASFTTAATYNSDDQPLTITDPLGHTTTYTYDADRNPASVEDARQNLTTYSYDADNELLSVAGVDGPTASYTYDADGNTRTEADGLNQTTQYTYDSLNRLTSIADPLHRQTLYGYDLASNLTALVDPQQRTTTLSYDNANRLTGVSYSDGSTPNVTFGYDADNQRVSMTDGTGSSSYSYDSLGRLIQSTNGANQSVSYGYDLAGNLTSLLYPGRLEVSRAYDSNGRLTDVTDWLQHTTRFSYDADSNMTSQTYPNGVTANLRYDAADELTKITDAGLASGPWIFGSGRDQEGQVTTATDRLPGMRHSYSYDDLNRLLSDTKANRTQTSWTYDNASQLTGISDTAQGTSSTLGYDAAGELTSLTALTNGSQTQNLTLSYNAEGDRTGSTDSVSGVSTTYGYNQANQLISYAKGSTTASYSYDGDGLRASKTVNGSSEGYVWDLAEGMPAMIEDGGTRYITGPGGLPIEQVDGSGATAYYLQDQLGSTRGLTDSTGQVVERATYDAYGNVKGQSGSVSTPFGYAGQYTDSESGLQYLRARYYDATTEQFLTVDPLAALTQQPYSYAGSNPANAVDPMGLDPQSACGCHESGSGILNGILGHLPAAVSIAAGLGALIAAVAAPEELAGLVLLLTAVSSITAFIALIQDLGAKKKDPLAILLDSIAIVPGMASIVFEIRAIALGARSYAAMVEAVQALVSGDALKLLVSYFRSQLALEGYESADWWSKLSGIASVILAGGGLAAGLRHSGCASRPSGSRW
jgi:RHS repeat-associated protein